MTNLNEYIKAQKQYMEYWANKMHETNDHDRKVWRMDTVYKFANETKAVIDYLMSYNKEIDAETGRALKKEIDDYAWELTTGAK